MKKYTYTAKAKAFLAVLHFIHKKDGTPYSGAEIAAGMNKKPFDSQYDSFKTKDGLYIHSDKRGLEQLQLMINKWKKNISGGYIVCRTGEMIFSWGKDCVFTQHALVHWEYQKIDENRTHIYLKGVSKIRDARLPEKNPLPVHATTLNTADYEKKILAKEALINAVVKNDTITLTSGQRLRKLYGTDGNK